MHQTMNKETMKQRLIITFTLLFIASLAHGQIIDRYGINIGVSYSTQVWDYKLISPDSDKDNKVGFMAFVQAEKDLGNILALRTEFGYIQKGFKNKFELTFPDGTSAGVNKDNVILHDLALNLGIKIKPLEVDYAPYIIFGLRGDYMFSYKDIVIKEQHSGIEYNLYKSAIEEFNKFNLGGLFSLGVDLKNLIYFEIEYNPNFTKNFDDTGLSIKDNYWGAKLGLNIKNRSK